MKGITVAGNMIVDNYNVVDVYPEHSTLTTIRQTSSLPGGMVVSCAVDLARLDPTLRIPVVGVIGDDANGHMIRRALGVYPQIDVDQLHQAGTTSFTDVVESLGDSTRTFFQYRGANALLDVEHFNFDQLEVPMLHVGYALLLDRLDAEDDQYGTRMARLLALAKERGMVTSLDVVSEASDRFTKIVPPALKYTDYCVVNEYEAAMITGVDVEPGGAISLPALKVACQKLLDMGVSRWAVVHWTGGGVALSPTGQWHVFPSVRLTDQQIKTTTGAGDAFVSGVLAAVANDFPMDVALKAGIGTAAASLLEDSPSAGVGSLGEMLNFYETSELVELPA